VGSLASPIHLADGICLLNIAPIITACNGKLLSLQLACSLLAHSSLALPHSFLSNKSLLQKFGNKGEGVRKCKEEAKRRKGKRRERI
jgi:hypothetical protein